MWKDFFQNDEGGFSIMRAALALALIVVLGVFVVSNAVLWYKTIRHPEIPFDMVDFKPCMVWVLGVAFSGKVGEKVIEKVSAIFSDKSTSDSGVVVDTTGGKQ